jgi:rhodanese-related sulfurtransferase
MADMTELPTITPDQIDSLPGPDWALLDVRTAAEWAQARIEGSVHIPLDQLIARVDEVPTKVVCVCAVGGRSAQATAYLNSTGREAVNLDGGIQRWAVEGRPLTAD